MIWTFLLGLSIGIITTAAYYMRRENKLNDAYQVLCKEKNVIYKSLTDYIDKIEK